MLRRTARPGPDDDGYSESDDARQCDECCDGADEHSSPTGPQGAGAAQKRPIKRRGCTISSRTAAALLHLWDASNDSRKSCSLHGHSVERRFGFKKTYKLPKAAVVRRHSVAAPKALAHGSGLHDVE